MPLENPCPPPTFVVLSDRENGGVSRWPSSTWASFLAVVAFGWGLSLATYRAFAGRIGWPMGAWHKQRPVLPIVVGIVAMLLAGAYAGARAYSGYQLSAAAIPVFGVAWAVFWTGFLRAGAQSALLLAPAAAVLLVVRWLA